jgi:hypothetical protein
MKWLTPTNRGFSRRSKNGRNSFIAYTSTSFTESVDRGKVRERDLVSKSAKGTVTTTVRKDE